MRTRCSSRWGRALFLLGAGSMHITDNFLASEGGGAPATDALASTVLVAWARLPTGKPAFHDNQVSFLMPDAPRGMEIASALLLSLDDLSCNDNQFEWHTQQRVVLAGIAQSQRREAKRLAASYPEDAPRIARDVERAAQVEQLQAEASAQAVLAGRAAQTFQQEGLFHGCVQQADGTPATAHGVILQMPAEKRSRTAKTDEAGYFRIELETGRAAGGQAKAPAWAEHLQRMAGFQPAQQEPAPSADAAAGPEPASSSTGEPTAVSTVTVLDEAGRMVLQDPAPPSFSDMRSEFRLYVLGGTGSGRARAGRG